MPRVGRATRAAIVRLSRDGWGLRRIADELGLAKSTVARVRFHLGIAPEAEAPEPTPSVALPTDRPLTAAELYHLEKEKRRAQPRPAILAAKAEYEAQLQRQRDLGKGGRPRKPGPIAARGVKPGKPTLHLKTDPADALLSSLGHFTGVGA